MNLARQAALPQTDAAWWRGATIYQVYPRSFADSNGDGIGDLPGVTAHIDYLASLGVDAIWLSPFYASPMRDFGYDISDYRAVDPIFGTLQDFDDLVARAHGAGLRIIVDQVYSHTSDQHAWFQESRQDRTNPKADWYVWADAKPDGSPPSNWQSVFGGPAWRWDARRRQYYLHNFLAEQPDLNVHSAAVQEALLETAKFWLDRGVDGFRLDAINFAMHDPSLRDNPPVPANVGKRTRPFDFQHHIYNQSHADIPAFLTRLRQLTESYGQRLLVAEVGGENSAQEMRMYTEGDDHLHSAYGFQFLYADKLNASIVRDCVRQWPGGPSEGWPSWAFSNHDAPRAISRWAAPADRKAMAELNLYLLAALRGSIFMYYGEELGLPQAHVPYERLQDPEAIANWPQTLGRDGARTPMPWRAGATNAGFSDVETWLPVDPEHIPLAVDAQERDPLSTLHTARRALALRGLYPALKTGDMRLHDAADPLLVFERGEGREALLCAFNLSDGPQTWRLPEGWRIAERFNLPDNANDVLAPYSGLLAVKA